MIALKIAEVKDFMNKLLCQDVFDHFLIQEAVITTNVSCHIDGTLQKDFYTLEELEEQNPGFPLFRMVFCAVPAST